MGLIKALGSAASGTLADQWAEYYYCESLDNNVLVQKGTKVVNSGSNTKGSENIITKGSGIAVNEGQAMLIVEDGKVVDFTVEAGRYTFDASSEPSLFTGGLDGLKESFKIFGKRFTYGGTEAKDQRVYFINLKENLDNKFGTATPMAYKDPTYRGIYIRYFGTYTFKIADPIRFFNNISGNIDRIYTKEQLMSQCKSEFINALDSAIAKCSNEGYQFNDLPMKQLEIADFMNDALDNNWREKRGMEVESVAIEKVTPDDESRKRIEEIDTAIMMSDSRVAAGRLAEAQARAMESAAKNENGAIEGFMGMGFAQNAGGMNAAQMLAGDNTRNQNLFDQSKVGSNADNKPQTGWTCECGNVNTGKFCSECGKPKPESTSWTCECGNVNTGKFCSECGKPKP